MNVEYIKKGLMNIGIIVREGNVVLFWRQAVVVLIFFIGVHQPFHLLMPIVRTLKAQTLF